MTRREVLVGAAGAASALVMCFAVYGRISHGLHAGLDADGYGTLGLNLYRGHGLAFDPAAGPTVYRGVLYPAFIALTQLLSGGWYPQAVWLAQSLLHGVTCYLVFRLAGRLVSPRLALLTGLAAAVYPILFWYAPRMWNESLLMPMVTGLALAAVRSVETRELRMTLVIGLLLGLLCLVKATFLPVIVVLPLAIYGLGRPDEEPADGLPRGEGLREAGAARLRVGPRRDLRGAVLAMLIAVAVVLPWTYRNYHLTHRLIPVHTGTGMNLLVGNVYGREFWSDPLSYTRVWDRYVIPALPPVRGAGGPQWAGDVEADSALLHKAMEELRADPLLWVKKSAAAGLMFWLAGDTPAKTAVGILLRLPVVVLGFWGAWILYRKRERRFMPVIALVLAYWLAHLPFGGPARLSTPVMPILAVLAAVACARIPAALGRR